MSIQSACSFGAVVTAFAVAYGCLAGKAWARDPAAAETLYRSAKDASKRGDWDTACAQFAESQRLDPAPGTLINLADCEERRGLIAMAWTHFTEAQWQFRPGDARAEFAKQRADALDKRVPRITIRLEAETPSDVKVFRDDQELGAPSIGVALPVEPGPHVITVRLSGAEKKFPITALLGTHSESAVRVLANPGRRSRSRRAARTPAQSRRTVSSAAGAPTARGSSVAASTRPSSCRASRWPLSAYRPPRSRSRAGRSTPARSRARGR